LAGSQFDCNKVVYAVLWWEQLADLETTVMAGTDTVTMFEQQVHCFKKVEPSSTWNTQLRQVNRKLM